MGSIRLWQATTLLGVLGIVALWIISHPEQFSAWCAWFARQFAWLSKRAERAAVSEDIHATVNKFVEGANAVSSGILPYKLHIQWQRITTREAFLREGKVVVKLDYHQNQDRNMALATFAFLANCILPSARPHLDESIRRGIDITMTRKVLASRRTQGALSWFAEYEVEPLFDTRRDIRTTCEHLDRIDQAGFFLPTLLRELDQLGSKLIGMTPRKQVTTETKELVAFLLRVAEKQRGEDVNPTFTGSQSRLPIVMVALPGKIPRTGVHPYVNFVRNEMRNGISTFYFVARGAMICNAERVTRACLSDLPLVLVKKVRHKVTVDDGSLVDAISIIAAVDRGAGAARKAAP